MIITLTNTLSCFLFLLEGQSVSVCVVCAEIGSWHTVRGVLFIVVIKCVCFMAWVRTGLSHLRATQRTTVMESAPSPSTPT